MFFCDFADLGIEFLDFFVFPGKKSYPIHLY